MVFCASKPVLNRCRTFPVSMHNCSTGSCSPSAVPMPRGRVASSTSISISPYCVVVVVIFFAVGVVAVAAVVVGAVEVDFLGFWGIVGRVVPTGGLGGTIVPSASGTF